MSQFLIIVIELRYLVLLQQTDEFGVLSHEYLKYSFLKAYYLSVEFCMSLVS
jgi:hypothetical protein